MAFFRFSTLSNSNASIQSAINSKENYDVLLLRKTVKNLCYGHGANIFVRRKESSKRLNRLHKCPSDRKLDDLR